MCDIFPVYEMLLKQYSFISQQIQFISRVLKLRKLSTFHFSNQILQNSQNIHPVPRCDACFNLPVNGFRKYGTLNGEISTEKDYLKINLDNKTRTFALSWLRDHCRCSKCYNSSTNQKNGVINLFGDADQWKPVDVTLDDHLKIVWKDGHETTYSRKWLTENSFLDTRREQVTPTYWSADKMKNVSPKVTYNDHMNTDSGLKTSIENLLKYGFTVVDGVPLSTQDTKKVAERICFILDTVFGKLWSFTSDGERADTAYTNLGIGAHTDTSYFTNPVGVQFLHCLEHTGEGGSTLLVDGHYAANQVLDDSPEDFKILTETIVPHEYIDNKLNDHYYSTGTVLSLSPLTKKLQNIRFNRYDMAPLITIPPERIHQFYTAYNRLESKITCSSNELWFKLQPGMVLFFDNWRLLHGRSGFTGKRKMCGGYLGKDDLSNVQRRFNLL